MMIEGPVQAQRQDTGRKASKEVRKQQLIDATIRILGQKGYSNLTVSDVAKAAGLSTGIIIFHFSSKDELLASALRHLAEEYRRNWQSALATAGDGPADRLAAILLSDFDPRIYNHEKLSAWIAFWGETQGRPTYDEICSAFDNERHGITLACCKALIETGGYPYDPHLTMQALDAMGDGLWLGVANAGSGLVARGTVADAQTVMSSALAAYFPRHFAMPKS